MYKGAFCFFLIISFLLTGINTNAQVARKKVGLVLGGGGAKGAAEVGVLKVLEEAGIPIDYIAGTSIGAIVGGLYSVGYDAADLDSLYRNQDWMFLLGDKVKRQAKTFLSKEEKEKYLIHIPLSKERKVSLPTGYLVGQNIVNFLSNLTVGYHQVEDFSTLPIPFRCVTVDLIEGKEVVLSSGSLPLAMRASMSIPGVFAPVEWNGKMLVDGGALNNLPVDVVRSMGADVVICVDLSTGWRKKEELKSVSDIADQLINIMGLNKYKQNKDDADIYINPPLKGYNAASFQRESIDSMMTIGEEAAREHWDELLALRKSIYVNETDTFIHPVRNKEPYEADSCQIRYIKIEGIDGKEKEWIKKRIALKENSNIKFDDIDYTIAKLQGLDIFSRVEYRLINSNPYDLVFLLEPKEHRRINIGARFDTEDLASIIANISNNQQISTRHHYSFTGRISHNPYVELEYVYGHLFGAKIGFDYLLGYHDFDLYLDKKDMDAMELISHSLSSFYTRDIGSFRLKAGVRFEYFDYHSDLYKRDGSLSSQSSKCFFDYFANFTMDSYDRRYYPTRGSRVNIMGTLHTDNGAGFDGDTPFGEVSFHAETALKLSNRLYLLPIVKGRLLFGSNIPAIFQNYVGGMYGANYLPWQIALESVQDISLLDNNVVFAKLALRYRFKDKIYLTAFGEYGKEAHDIPDILAGRDIWGCGLRLSYDFIVGPIGLQVNYSNLSKNAGIYINAGFSF